MKNSENLEKFTKIILQLCQGHRGVNYAFYKLILFYRVISKLQVAFYRLKKFELVFLRYDQSNYSITGTSLERKTNTAKKDYSI